ncbi:TPA: peptide chain release factor N(5)-glutamine methyltransferase [Candidatus Scatousia excrementigallinarum]|uniref:peptide chain release factor N(5)-glutamine methyltransferase n=1 Tax=Candidatus Scatousia excrementigallinarum TaxID=2840935 RepID=A0A9D1EWY7_9BACT|nr:peptide chain release factor N(5)-glutamine methyltransferase [Candidatus Scatousia excrementigallinarum]
MTIQDIVKILTDSGIEPNEANVEVKMLIEHFAGYGVKDIIMGKKLDEKKLALVKEKAELRAKTRQPIQHITGFADFMGEKFIVNSSVLIPRDETEILVRKAVEIIKENNFKMALDVGTGSGCIACMVAKHSGCQIIGLDISTDALNTALDNASRLNLFNKAIFRKSDIFSNVKPGESFDIIISNPPYIPPREKANLQKEVSFDPDIALFTKDPEGLDFYEKIIKESPSILNKNGFLIFELGIGQAQAVKNLMCKDFTEVQILKDLAGIDRVIYGKLKIRN